MEDKEDVLLFKNNNKYYKVVIKTTINKNENYIKSFRLLSEKEFNKYKKKKIVLIMWTSASPLSPIGSVARFTVSKLSFHIHYYIFF